MNEKQKQDYVDLILSGGLPKQESFSQEEMKYLVISVATWASEQVRKAVASAMHDDIPNLVQNCEYETIEEAIKDVQETFEEEILKTADFISEFIGE
jgi:hypothetical protein